MDAHVSSHDLALWFKVRVTFSYITRWSDTILLIKQAISQHVVVNQQVQSA